MPFRTVIISSHSKLEYSLNYLVYKTIEETKKIVLDEIHTLIIESTMVSITSSLLVELMNKKIKVIFCDEKKNPHSELIPYYGNSQTVTRIEEQINWSKDIKDSIWQRIVIEKIKNQAKVLSLIDKKEADKLFQYSNEVEIGDITNREGHAAKVYFNRLMGLNFSRGGSDKRNIYLNYGYSILLSQINRCIVSKGYLTQLGIHHKNDFNQFNLSCDFIEPLRPIVDKLSLSLNDENYKSELINMLNTCFIINGQNQSLHNAIEIYCASIFRSLNTGTINEIVFIEII